jgi:hypothetical protein
MTLAIGNREQQARPSSDHGPLIIMGSSLNFQPALLPQHTGPLGHVQSSLKATQGRLCLSGEGTWCGWGFTTKCERPFHS